MSAQPVVDLLRKYYVSVGTQHATLAALAKQGKLEPLPYGPTAFHVLSPEGKKLLSDASGLETEALVKFLEAGIRKVGKITPRNMKTDVALYSHWGVGTSKGAAHVGLFFRFVNNFNEYRVLRIDLKQLRALAPRKAEVGTTYPISPTACEAFLPMMGYVPPWYQDQVTKAHVQARVIAVTKDTVEVHLTGQLTGKNISQGHVSQCKIEGLLTFSRNHEPRSLLLVNEGTFTPSWGPYNVQGLMQWHTDDGARRVGGIHPVQRLLTE